MFDWYKKQNKIGHIRGENWLKQSGNGSEKTDFLFGMAFADDSSKWRIKRNQGVWNNGEGVLEKEKGGNFIAGV